MSFSKKLIIAIDGYSSCGKSTFAKAIAQMLNYIYIDTGAMYRAVTLYAIQNDIILNGNINKEKLTRSLGKITIQLVKNEKEEITETWLNGKNVENEIRGLEVSKYVSPVSQIKEVRKKMVDFQRKMGKEKGIVMDGRDIGTVVFPNADIKIFMTAYQNIRAQRRFDELQAKGIKTSFNEIKKNILERDYLDSHRKESPLIQSSDATVLDNSYMTPDEQIAWFKKLFQKKFNS
jgi:cytidylate kinase